MKEVKCPECKGKGEVYPPPAWPPKRGCYVVKVKCRCCQGSGNVSPERKKAWMSADYLDRQMGYY